VGTARAALFNYLFAKRHGGTFIVRIEDTDKARSTAAFDEDIRKGLEWLGLSFDALYRQSERTDLYTNYLEKLVASGSAYVSHEQGKEDAAVMVDVVRLKNPGKTITFSDLIRGEISFDTTELGDFVIARSMTEPLYHLAVVVDDHEMGITHVIRGEDHISNTPRQILIQEALGFDRPQYAHIPLILAPDRSKLSKRHGATAVTAYKEMGVLPEAMVNYLAFLGWNPGGERELYALAELAETFTLEQIQKGGAVFNMEKLTWFNKEYLKRLPEAELLPRVLPFIPAAVRALSGLSEEKLRHDLPVILERVNLLADLTTMGESGELSYLFEAPSYEKEKLFWKEERDAAKTGERLTEAKKRLEAIASKEFMKNTVKEAIWGYAETEGRGAVLWPLRVALSGAERSPDPFTLCELLGKEESLARIETALAKVR
jgi:glutamyl-tRNA synthetase